MVLDQEARIVAERLTLDVEIEVIAKPLAGFRTRIATVGLCRAEQTEAHVSLSRHRSAPNLTPTSPPHRVRSRPRRSATLQPIRAAASNCYSFRSFRSRR